MGCTDGQPRGLLGIKRMNKFPNARIKQLCKRPRVWMKKIDAGVLRWFGHVERIENDRIAKRVYVGECAGSRSVGGRGRGELIL